MPVAPKVLLVGGVDVDARLELMHLLSDVFEISVLGSSETLYPKFLEAGFSYTTYALSRRVNPFVDMFTFVQLFFYFRKMKPQLIHAFDTKPCVWARLAARLAGVPLIVGTLPGLGSLYVDNSVVSRLLRAVYQGLQQMACHFSDLTIFQNRDDARQFIAAGVVSSEKIAVIPGSGVSTQLFNPTNVPAAKCAELRVELGIAPKAKIVTMVARVIRSKGVFEFVAAAQEVRKNYPDVQFLLVGPDDHESLDRLSPPELERLKQALIWPGPRRDIPAILTISDIFVLPSAYREGIPRVLLEAASMGLPIITTDSPGCNEVVENEINGLLIPVRDSPALTQAILRLLDEPELCQRFGNMSRQKAIERFDINVIAFQTRRLYQHLLSGKKLPIV